MTTRRPLFASLLAIHPDVRLVIRGAHVKEHAPILLLLVGEVLLVPNRAFIEEERLALRVPITRHLQLWRLGIVILNGKWIAGLGLLIQKPPILFFYMMKTEQS